MGQQKRDHEFRERWNKSVGSEDLRGESERSQPSETTDDAEARKDFWSIQGVSGQGMEKA